MDKNGLLYTPEECVLELKEYMKQYPDLYKGEDADYIQGVNYYAKD
jgi:hypothetical protein